MRVLALVQGNRIEDQPGYNDGFRRLLSQGVLQDYRAIPYRGYASNNGWSALYKHAFETAEEMEADAVFLQFFHGDIPSPVHFIRSLRRLPMNPTIFTSCGDPFGPFLRPAPRSLILAATESDITFTTGMGRLARQLTRNGARNIVLVPHGYCQVLFGSGGHPHQATPDFDMVFIGNLSCFRNPTSHMFWSNRQRGELVKTLSRRYGKRFAIFGHGWEGNPSWHGPIPYEKQEEICRKGRLVFGGYPNAMTDYYTSDREFIATISGVPLVDFQVPRVDRIFRNNEHIFLFSNRKEMITLCDRLLEQDASTLHRFGTVTAEYCRNRHSQYHRVRLMMEIVSQVREAHLAGRPAPLPKLDFFHDGVRLEEEYPYAIHNWC